MIKILPPRAFSKMACAAAALVIFFPSLIYADENASAGNKSLNLRIRNVGQRHCFPDAVGPILYLDLALIFTNVSQHAVILSRRIENPPILRGAKSLEDAGVDKFDYSPNIDSFLAKLPPSPPTFGKSPDPKRFVVLKPREGYETIIPAGFWVPVNSDSAQGAYGYVPGTAHVIQVGVDTWPYDWPHYAPADAEKLSERWSSFGDLAYGMLNSDFLAFTVPAKFEYVSCEGFNPGFHHL